MRERRKKYLKMSPILHLKRIPKIKYSIILLSIILLIGIAAGMPPHYRGDAYKK